MASIGTDAHAPGKLVFLEVGIAAAILAGVPASVFAISFHRTS